MSEPLLPGDSPSSVEKLLPRASSSDLTADNPGLLQFQEECDEAAAYWGQVSGILFFFTFGLVVIPLSILPSIGVGVLVRWRVKRWLLKKDPTYVKKIRKRGLVWRKYTIIGSVVAAIAGFLALLFTSSGSGSSSRSSRRVIIIDDD